MYVCISHVCMLHVCTYLWKSVDFYVCVCVCVCAWVYLGVRLVPTCICLPTCMYMAVFTCCHVLEDGTRPSMCIYSPIWVSSVYHVSCMHSHAHNMVTLCTAVIVLPMMGFAFSSPSQELKQTEFRQQPPVSWSHLTSVAPIWIHARLIVLDNFLYMIRGTVVCWRWRWCAGAHASGCHRHQCCCCCLSKHASCDCHVTCQSPLHVDHAELLHEEQCTHARCWS